MPNYCFVENCNSTSNKKRKDQQGNAITYSFHKFPNPKYPASLESRAAWKAFAVGANGPEPTPNSRICSRHFPPWFFEDTPQGRHLVRGVRPTIDGCTEWQLLRGATADERYEQDMVHYTTVNEKFKEGMQLFSGTRLFEMLWFSRYAVWWSRSWKIPYQTEEHMTPNSAAGSTDINDIPKFRMTQALDRMTASCEADYDNSPGLVIGQMVPPGNQMASYKHLAETYELCNVVARYSWTNENIMANVDEFGRSLALDSVMCVAVTGNLVWVDPKKPTEVRKIGNGVWVPTHFYKLYLQVRKDGKLALYCFCIENMADPVHNAAKRRNIQPEHFLTDLATVEKISTFTFFDKVKNYINYNNDKENTAAQPMPKELFDKIVKRAKELDQDY